MPRASTVLVCLWGVVVGCGLPAEHAAGLTDRAALTATHWVHPDPSVRQGAPALAFDGEAFAVVWEQELADGGIDAWGTRVFLDGGLATPRLLAPANDNQRTPVLAFDGTRYLLVWAHAFVPFSDPDVRA